MRKTNYRKRLLARIESIRKRNPMGYAQLLLMPFGVVPAYAMDDESSDWWTSQEAKERLDSLQED